MKLSKTVVLLSLLFLALLPAALPRSNKEVGSKRLIVHTTSNLDKLMFRLKGCEIVHELRDGTSLKCPQNIEISNSEPDAVLHVLDLSSDAQIRADKVWSIGYTGTGVTVAVLDTGIDYTHLQLSSSSDSANGHCFAITANDCGNGFFDDNGHGTHVSGIITSDGLTDSNNANGYLSKGVSPGANIWMAKVCDGAGSCYTSDIAAAIQYVVNNKIAKVISISIGGGGTTGANCDSDYLASQVNWAYANGVVTVVAAGNSGNSKVSSPACASKAVAVAAVDSSDTLASFSTYGNALKDHGVAAPGVNIYSTLPGNSYASWSGTSMATPQVSATVALILQKNPNMAPADIRATLFSSANCLNNKYGACPNIYIGYGRVDALGALTPYLSLSASLSTITTTQTSTITTSTSDNTPNVGINFVSDIGTVGTSCNTGSTGTCSVTFTSTTAGTGTITGTAAGYASGSTSVKVTQTPVTYSATFSESGLPSSTTWGVTAGGKRYTSKVSSVGVSGLSGSVSYIYDSSITVGRTRYTCSTGCSGTVTSTNNAKTATYRTASRA